MSSLDCGKREQFAQLVASGLSQSDAYRDAFRSKAKPNTVHVEASKLMADPKVRLRVESIKQQLAEIGLWSRIDSVKILSEIANGEDGEARPSDRVNAVKALNQMHGWDKQVIDHTSSDRSMTPTRIEIVAGGTNDDKED